MGVAVSEVDATESPQTGSLQTSNREHVIATNYAEVARNGTVGGTEARRLLLTLPPRLNKLAESSCDSARTHTLQHTYEQSPYVMRGREHELKLFLCVRVLDTILESCSKLTAIKVPRQHTLRDFAYRASASASRKSSGLPEPDARGLT